MDIECCCMLRDAAQAGLDVLLAEAASGAIVA